MARQDASAGIWQRPKRPFTSASLIGRLGSSAFRLSTTAVVDVARGLVLLYGIGTSALPSWDPRMGWSNLMGGLAGSGRQVQADMRTHHIHRPARDTIPPPGGTRASSYCDWS